MCMWSYAASTMPVAGIFGGIVGRYLARSQAHQYLVGHHRDAPQGPSLRDTYYVLGAYVTMYLAKERNKSIAQVGILTKALLVQYIAA